MEKLLDILICTLDSRTKQFDYISEKLANQITSLGVDVSIIFFKDNREHSIGHKRNVLLADSKAEYICFVDDDDDVSDSYLLNITKALGTSPDCASLTGIITFNGTAPKKFIHSIRYNSYFEKDKVYFRPPNHLNAIRREIAAKFTFPEVNFSEDTDWAMQIAKAGVLQTESWIEEPIYYYKFNSVK
jgi:hypothetical protein